jgi:hypothetical protein
MHGEQYKMWVGSHLGVYEPPSVETISPCVSIGDSWVIYLKMLVYMGDELERTLRK